MHRATTRRGFSVVEVFVVVLVVSLLLALTLPAVNTARESGRRVMCTHHLRNLGLAIHHYESANHSFPPASQFRIGGRFDRSHPPDPPRHSVVTFLLPFIDEADLFTRFDMRFDWNDKFYSNNDELARQDLGGILHCPSAPDGREAKHTSDYTAAIRIDPTVSSGLGTLIRRGVMQSRTGPSTTGDFGNWSPAWDGLLQRYAVNHSERCHRRCEDRRIVRPAKVRDGLSNTFILFENAGKPDCYQFGQLVDSCHITRFRWASSTLYMTINDYCQSQQLINCHNNSQPYAFHSAGANFVMGDASVHFVQQSMDADVFVSLFTLAAGDTAGIWR